MTRAFRVVEVMGHDGSAYNTGGDVQAGEFYAGHDYTLCYTRQTRF